MTVPVLSFDDAIRLVSEKRAEFEEAQDSHGVNVTDASLVALRAARVRAQRTPDALPTAAEGEEAVRRLGIDVPAWAKEMRARVESVGAVPRTSGAWRVEGPSLGPWRAVGPEQCEREEAERDAEHASMRGSPGCEHRTEPAKVRTRCMGCGHFDNEVEAMGNVPCEAYGSHGHYMIDVDERGMAIPDRERPANGDDYQRGWDDAIEAVHKVLGERFTRRATVSESTPAPVRPVASVSCDSCGGPCPEQEFTYRGQRFCGLFCANKKELDDG